MSLVGSLADLLWGTPVYTYGVKAYQSAVNAYLRVSPTYRLAVDDASAVFYPATFMEWNNIENRIWDEEAVLRHLLAHIEEDDVFYDVGANIGIYCCLVDSLLTDGTVVAFEPYPPNVERLRVNLAANGIETPIQQRPLSDRIETATFYLYDTDEAGAQHGSLDTIYPSSDPIGSFSTETVAGDRLVERGEIPAPTVVKIDVQGTGPAVIDGLAESLSADRCRFVYVEAHDNAEQLRTRLQNLGFSTVTLRVDRPGKDPTIVGYRKDADLRTSDAETASTAVF
ncbi:FkbM family methyltransferase [Haloprofundus halophilus]|uniref:FkbM family methyltransferase n=1 Tax=Haloprofundus halophilus TaxID=2283527 RepID=UPI000E42F7B2|nr:FkbM family methyltransferase [Haloprofundus halophilus]